MTEVICPAEEAPKKPQVNNGPAMDGSNGPAKFSIVDEHQPADYSNSLADPTKLAEELDAEEAEFRAIRRDLPGVKGAGGAGIVSISVSKIPGKNEFFRTHPEFSPIVPLVDHEMGMDRHFFVVTPDMVEPLISIGITPADYRLFLTVTSLGGLRIVPVRQATADGEQNEWARTKELGLVRGIGEWVRLFADLSNHNYKIFAAPAGRYGEPQWPGLKQSKIFKLAFRDKGRLINSDQHPLFLKWSARDSDD